MRTDCASFNKRWRNDEETTHTRGNTNDLPWAARASGGRKGDNNDGGGTDISRPFFPRRRTQVVCRWGLINSRTLTALAELSYYRLASAPLRRIALFPSARLLSGRNRVSFFRAIMETFLSRHSRPSTFAPRNSWMFVPLFTPSREKDVNACAF